MTFRLRINERTTLKEIMPQIFTGQVSKQELLQGEIIGPHEIPKYEQWCLYPLYTIDQKKKKRIWHIGYDPRTNEIVTIHGCVGGGITPDRRVVVVKGDKSVQSQALQDAKHKYEVKWRQGYRPANGNGSTKIPAQEAIHYGPPWMPRIFSNQTSNLKFPVGVQPKIDGVRARIWLERDLTGKEVVNGYTRNNIKYKFMREHLQEIGRLFAYLPPGVGIDGEWYNHEMTFDEINGISRRDVNKSDRESELKLYIFDIIIAGKTLEERYSMIINAYMSFLSDGHPKNFFEVLSITWANSHEELVDFHNQYVSMGYEGLMIRKTAMSKPKKIDESYYRGKRNNSLLKFKTFIEEEVTIVEVKEAEGRDRGTAIFNVKDSEGRVFPVRPKGSKSLRKEWFDNPLTCIGRCYTIKFYEKTQYGLPRFPIGKAFRDTSKNKGKVNY